MARAVNAGAMRAAVAQPVAPVARGVRAARVVREGPDLGRAVIRAITRAVALQAVRGVVRALRAQSRRVVVSLTP